MRTIERAGLFKKDYKRILKQPRHAKDIAELLKETITRLVFDAELPPAMEDHPLAGDWSGYRDCHIKPDLLLIYKKIGDDVLRLARLGSHSELFK